MEKYVKYAPIALFCLSVGKLLFQPSWEGVGCAVVTGLLAGAYELKSQDKKVKEMEARFETQVKDLNAKHEILTTVINNHAKAFEDIKTHVSGLNLARNLKQSQQAPNPIQKIF